MYCETDDHPFSSNHSGAKSVVRSVPQTSATTFVFSSVCYFFYAVRRWPVDLKTHTVCTLYSIQYRLGEKNIADPELLWLWTFQVNHSIFTFILCVVKIFKVNKLVVILWRYHLILARE